MRLSRMTKLIAAPFRAFASDRSASMAIVCSCAILLIATMAAFTLEASNLYMSRLKAQRVADIATLAAANTSTPIVSGSPSATATATAVQVAKINGYSGATTSVITGSDGSSYVSASLQEAVPLTIGALLNRTGSVLINGTSAASVTVPTGDCVRTLVGYINVFSSTTVNGARCTIASATYLYACTSTIISVLAIEVAYSSAAEQGLICPSATVTPSLANFSYGVTSVDPLKTDSRTTAITSRLAAMATWPYGTLIPKQPIAVAVTGGSDATYSGTTATLTKATKYKNLTVTNSTLYLNSSGSADPSCSNPLVITGNIILSGTNRLILSSGCYLIGGYLKNSDGATTSVETTTGSSVQLAFAQYISNGTGTLNFGNADVSLVGGISNDAGKLSFGNGTLLVGAAVDNKSGTLSFGTGPYYFNGGSMSNATGTVSFAGGAFYLWGGSITNTSGTMTFGDGPYYFYGGSLTNSSGTMTFGRGDFQFQGGSVTSGAGSTTRFDVGNMNLYGGSITLYGDSATIGGDGDFSNGASSVFFYGGSMTLSLKTFTAIGTTFAFRGGSATILGSGTINTTAPRSSSPTYGYRDILIYIYGGSMNYYRTSATDSLSGIIYIPGTYLGIHGNTTISPYDGGCLQALAGIIDIYNNINVTFAPCGNSTTTTSTVLVR